MAKHISRRPDRDGSQLAWRLMEPAKSPVIEIDGDFSSPDAPRGTAGTKSNSKYVTKKSHRCKHPNYLQTRADSLSL